MKLHSRFRTLLGLAGLAASLLLIAPAQASNTNIAQVPLLNITGTGTIKPNLMLLFDNSGSMDWSYLPDSVGTGSTNQCRRRTALRDATGSLPNTLCSPGHPPFMNADFNRVYYNPEIRYQPPIKFDGTSYPEMTKAYTTNWTSVPMDGFSSRALDLYGNSGGSATATTNLVTGFPDLKWCDEGTNYSNCRTNTATYTYPDATFFYPKAITTNPYYYNIGVAQYCTDASLTNCVSTTVGAAAPAGYPKPAKIRWCDTVNLNNCQAKQVGNFKYPSFSTATGAAAAYGTIAIGASASTSSLQITSVKVGEPTTLSTITGSAAIPAAKGTDTLAKQQAVASLLASSIMSKTGLTNQYWACVRNPIGTVNVNPCSAYGINLTADNIVAVIPLDCNGGAKTVTNCSPATDGANAGWGFTVAATSVASTPGLYTTPATALLDVAGASRNNGNPSLASVTWNSTILAQNIALGTSTSNTNVVSLIVNAIKANSATTNYTAAIGGDPVTPTCAGKTNATVCLINVSGTSNGNKPTYGTVTDAGTLAFNAVTGAGYATYDTIPVTTAAITAGNTPPSTFSRVDIVSTNNSYPRAAGRIDCVGSSCTYFEEMTNFANWYAYYKTRIQMTKTAVGLSFASVTGNFRVGLSKMSVVAPTSGSPAIDIKPADFTGTARQTWYSTFYGTTTSGSTPTRDALDGVGKMFANASPFNYATGYEVVQYPCQQNFILLTTDGYWNQGYSGAAISSDAAEDASRFCLTGKGCVDTRGQSVPSLADVALYWYNGGSNNSTVSLRPSIDDMSKPGVVPAAAGENSHLHVSTFTLGLGIDGVMNYESNYDTAPAPGGDFYNLITRAATGCPWNGGGAYVWPDPQVTAGSTATVQERVDDLWHAAINGHGKYFSASEPRAVQAGLTEALSSITIRTGAASAAATSTPNISRQDNDIFTDVFTTGRWYGEMANKKIDPVTGAVLDTVIWNTSNRLGLTVTDTTDTRLIYMFNTGGSALKEFKYASMSAAEQAWFDNKCSQLAQCALLSAGDKAVVNAGTNIVDWLRGRQKYADGTVLRDYTMTTPPPGATAAETAAFTPLPIILGDIASSKPAYVKAPTRNYSTAGYSAWKLSLASRAPTVYAGANDGMLHAFNALTGDERWAYVPRIIMQKLYKQASTNYASNHQFTADGSPEVSDVQIGGVWRTMLVAGLNGGGRGYYAIDVTDPVNPVPKWELCADAAICAKNDPDIGLTFGSPQFGYWQGKWVVYLTSGYNNVSGVDNVSAGATGHGFLYIVDVADGTVLKKIDTGNGSVGTPSGLAKITAISNNPATDPVTTYIYGGDNLGQMWRFDLTSATPGQVTALKMGDAGASQPVTTAPDITQCQVMTNGVPSVTRMVAFGTGRLLDLPDTTDTARQSVYMLKDSGSAIANIRGASMVQQALSTLGSSTNTNTYGVTNRKVDLATKDGWYVDLDRNSGERVNLDPQIVSGGLNVVTTIPTSSSSCSVGGSSNVYQFAVCGGSSITAPTDPAVTGGPTNPGQPDVIFPVGKTLSGDSAAVGFIIVRLSNGVVEMVYTTADGKNKKDPLQTPSALSARKAGWRSVNGE